MVLLRAGSNRQSFVHKSSPAGRALRAWLHGEQVQLSGPRAAFLGCKVEVDGDLEVIVQRGLAMMLAAICYFGDRLEQQ